MLNTVAYGFYPNGEGVALAVNGEEGLIVHPKKLSWQQVRVKSIGISRMDTSGSCRSRSYSDND